MFALTRVMIAEDHPLFRDALEAILRAEPDFELVGTARDGTDAVTMAERLRPDVLVLDISMPDLSGAQVMETLRARGVDLRVLVLSTHEEMGYVDRLRRAGATGYLSKAAPPESIPEAVRAVARGEAWWGVAASDDPRLLRLSVRERQVLRALCAGRSNAELAEELHVSEHTVRNHLAAIYEKLDVSSAREAMAWAWQNGVAEPST